VARLKLTNGPYTGWHRGRAGDDAICWSCWIDATPPSLN